MPGGRLMPTPRTPLLSKFYNFFYQGNTCRLSQALKTHGINKEVNAVVTFFHT